MRAAVRSLPATPGVYRFRDEGGRVLYIGRATQLRSRVGSYWGDLRDRRHLRRMVPLIARVEAVACDSVHEAAWLERNLLERSKPRWNRIRGGMEAAVCIRVSEDAGITLVHWPAPGDDAHTFGPYLGGAQGRLAVSALDRVLPLRYTRERLDGGLRDLARIRGVDPSQRAELLAAVLAVLRREEEALEAVRGKLVVLRDRASANLAFELAARIHEEIDAVDWIAAEQKVTRLRSVGDQDVYGWSDGLLVRFRIRGGRLDGWEQRTTSQRNARRYLDLTPPAWVAFAARNAELAREIAASHVP
ncbi:GIY-YIG nuclease family protein [Actinoplanes sp. URMC 104]|uniref:GIY-YIG nuclease family protein n=1 Tax=Actinoplanes sp. URMC 104 TaxID=3423409 RepID=UPI003F1CB874